MKTRLRDILMDVINFGYKIEVLNDYILLKKNNLRIYISNKKFDIQSDGVFPPNFFINFTQRELYWFYYLSELINYQECAREVINLNSGIFILLNCLNLPSDTQVDKPMDNCFKIYCGTLSFTNQIISNIEKILGYRVEIFVKLENGNLYTYIQKPLE